MTFTSRSPFAAPGEKTRGLWRALAEVTGGTLLMLPFALLEWELGGSLSAVARLLLGSVVLVLLAVRRRFPATSLLGVAVVLGLLPPVGLPAAVIAYTTARESPVHRRRTAVLLASVALTALVGLVFAPLNGLGSHAFGLALGGTLAATTLVVPALVGTAHGQQSRLLRALHERAVAAEEVRRLTDSEVRIHERSRIAAEMHDLVGHRLSLVSLHSGGLELALRKESPQLHEVAGLVRRSAGDAMRELREVLGVLGPLGRDTGTGALTDTTGTRSDIEALAEESRRGGIPLGLTWDGPDLAERPALVRRAVHRVVRESLTNVHRHAAGAQVTVTVTHTEDRVELLVGNGPPPAGGPAAGAGTGRGLVGLRERVSVLGGTLEAGPAPGGGFAVTASVPARPAGESASGDPDTPETGPAAPLPGRPAGAAHRAAGALTGALGLLGVALMMTFGLILVSEAANDDEALAPPEPPRIGMSREEVESLVYGDHVLARAAATGREPARPESVTDCLYPAVDDVLRSTAGDDAPLAHDGPGHLRMTRYCFRDDKLAAIDHFTVPVVSRTPPWESP
jgi:signal transduction histidine kinase